MIDTDKYEGMTYNNDYKMGIELEIAVGNLLAEVKRLRQENDELHAQRVQFSWIQEARGGQSNAFELLAEVKRLREAIADIADEMEQVVCTEYEQEIIEDLRKVIE